MQVIHPCCCGLDMHKDTVVACVRQTPPDGSIDSQGYAVVLLPAFFSCFVPSW